MGYPTAIEWTDATWNPVGGCTIHSPGCSPYCYAMQLAAHPRLNKHPLYAGTTDIVKGRAVWNGKLTKLPDNHEGWTWPLSWRGAKNPKLGKGKPSLIFVGDMTDVFHQDRPREDIDRVVATILHSRHIGQFLTKRPDVMCEYFEQLCISGRWLDFPHPYFGKPNFDPCVATWQNAVLPRLWLGSSAERQQEANARRPWMRDLADIGFTTFVSYEPALGPVDWSGWEFLKQIIAGGASGKFATPPCLAWFTDTRDWCAANGIAFLFKQWGEWAPCADDLSDWSPKRCCMVTRDGRAIDDARVINAMPPETEFYAMQRIGKDKAGRTLDGKTHDAFPEVA